MRWATQVTTIARRRAALQWRPPPDVSDHWSTCPTPADDVVTALAGANDEAAGDIFAQDLEDIGLTISLVLVHAITVNERGQGDARKIRGRACLWLGLSTFLIFVATFLLISLTMSSNWNACTKPDDCKVGTACVKLVEGGKLQRPLCLDCYFLVDSDTFGDGAPWPHALNGYDFTGVPQSQWVNASETCIEQLYDPVNLEFHEGQYNFGHCLGALKVVQQMSNSDLLILLIAFFMITMEIVMDAREQDFSGAMRRHLLPVWQPLPRQGGARVLWSWTWSLLARCIVKVVEMLYSKAVRALIPMTMVMMLIVYGASAIDIILNGLSVTFVLQLDNIVPAGLLSPKELEEIRTFIKRELAELRQDVRDQPPSPLKGQDAFGRKFEVFSCVCSTATAFLWGFFSSVSWNAKITCEMQVFYLYYRVAIFVGLWMPFVLRETLVVLSSIFKIITWGAGTDEDRKQQRSDIVKLLIGSCVGFSDTMIVAILLNTTFWLGCNTFWEPSTMMYAIEYYLWGFIKDFFGICAASGYMDVYGWECLPFAI